MSAAPVLTPDTVTAGGEEGGLAAQPPFLSQIINGADGRAERREAMFAAFGEQCSRFPINTVPSVP